MMTDKKLESGHPNEATVLAWDNNVYDIDMPSVDRVAAELAWSMPDASAEAVAREVYGPVREALRLMALKDVLR